VGESFGTFPAVFTMSWSSKTAKVKPSKLPLKSIKKPSASGPVDWTGDGRSAGCDGITFPGES